jgi:OOP family OmpA-OmpF porin
MAMEEGALRGRNTGGLRWRRTTVSHSTSFARRFCGLTLCGLVSACSFSASVEAGGSKSPEPPPPAEPPVAPAVTAPSTPAAPAAQKANVKVVGARLVLPGSITFQADTATLEPGTGDAALGELVKYLDQNARVTRLRIEGHTNNVRPPAQSMQLSGQRASAVKQWLRQAGINEGRLLAVGFGETRPLASNADAAGQAQNERIEFKIAELDGKPYMGPDPLAGGTEFP